MLFGLLSREIFESGWIFGAVLALWGGHAHCGAGEVCMKYWWAGLMRRIEARLLWGEPKNVKNCSRFCHYPSGAFFYATKQSTKDRSLNMYKGDNAVFDNQASLCYKEGSFNHKLL
mmetsp:Transcript_4988/g.9272  ORF Transcript_4988/g.9272 Transcript_4988/m.9272 type:complete len:116 (-) Transcript_4988:113-460(-)